jgi:hypothetical protein
MAVIPRFLRINFCLILARIQTEIPEPHKERVVNAADTEVETAAMEIGFAPENHYTFLGAFTKIRHTIHPNYTEAEVNHKVGTFPN